jgi:hypothetical protein
MTEHDDDLESEVREEAEEEMDTFPDTGDELDVPEGVDDEDDDLNIDDDEAEL